MTDAVKQIPLRRRDGTVRAYALVDAAADAMMLSERPWRMGTGGYAVRGRSGQREYMHRVLLGLARFGDDRREVDHINGDRLDNRSTNLRVVSRAENGQNKAAHPDTTSPFRGVCWATNRSRWRAKVMIDGRTVFDVLCRTELDAAMRVEIARQFYMPYAEIDPLLVAALGLRRG